MKDFDNFEDEEEMEENVYIDEKEAVLEEDLFINQKKQDTKKIDDGGDFYEGYDDEEDEKQKTLLETEKSPEVAPIKIQKIQDSKKTNKEVKKEGVEVKVEDKNNEKVIVQKKKTNKKPVKKEAKTKIQKNNKKKNKNYFWPIVISLLIIAIIVFAVIYFQKSLGKEDVVVAKVNGQEITLEDLNKEYEFFFFMGGIPEEYKSEITKEIFLVSSLIPEEIILQEAKKIGIYVSDKEVDDFITTSLIVPGVDIKQFEAAAESRGLSMKDIHKYLKRQLISFKLLNETVLGEIEVTEEEVTEIYNENLILFASQNKSFEDVKEYIRQTILTQKQRDAAQNYMDDVKLNSVIEVYYTEEGMIEVNEEKETENIIQELSIIKTYEVTGDDMCYDNNGKPLVILYSTTYCPHCLWIKDTFASVVGEYEGISSYLWELDTGNNALTEEIESTLPREHIDILKKYNSNGYVPAFVIGCKYYRIGNGGSGDLVNEANELRAVIEEIIA